MTYKDMSRSAKAATTPLTPSNDTAKEAPAKPLVEVTPAEATKAEPSTKA